MKRFYTAALILALAAFAAAQEPTPQQPTTAPPSDTMQQPAPTVVPEAPQARPDADATAVDDSTLHRQLHEQFSTDAAFRNVQVTVEEGKVRLEGTVASKEDKKRAKEMAKSMAGVRKVKSKLEVDEEMGAAMGTGAEAGAEARPESDVTGETQVTQPSTTPPSTVPQSAEPQTAQPSTTQPSTTQPSTTPDTTQPQSDQTAGVTTMPAGGELKTQIETAFKNEPTLTGTNVIINVTETTVELTGTVPTGKERQTAKRIAQSFAGNRRVEDRMTITGMGQDPSQTNQPNQTPPPTPPNL